jgi:hypothetical protein
VRFCLPFHTVSYSPRCVYLYLQSKCKIGSKGDEKRSTAVRFELTRVTPIDFESIALTARPSCPTPFTAPHTTTHRCTHPTIITKRQNTHKNTRNSTPFITSTKQHPHNRTTNSNSKLTPQLHQCYNTVPTLHPTKQ